MCSRHYPLLVALAVTGATARAQWGPETPLTSTTGDVWGEGIAASGDTLHLVYGTSDIWYRRSADQGQTWSAPRRLGAGVLHLTDPIVADGNDVWVVYLDNIQNQSDWCCVRDMGNIWMLRSRDGGNTWDAPVQLSVPSKAFRLSLAYAANRLHLVWMDYRSGAWDTYYRRSGDRGATWDPEVVLAQSTGPFGAERPQVAARGDSVHVTIWDDRANNPPCTPGSFTFPKCPDTFHVRSVNGGTTWGVITNVADGGAYFSGRNDVAIADPGDVVINYNVDVPGETGSKLFVVRSGDDGATWGTPVRLTFSANASDHGSIIGSGRSIHLVWHDDRAPGNREIYYRGSSNGGATWDAEEQVSSGAAGDSSTPLDAVTSDYVHVIWIDNRGGSYQVYYRSRSLPVTPAPDGGGPPDGGSNMDGGALSDAGTGADAGGDGPPLAGCGCEGDGGPALLVGFGLMVLFILLGRRRAVR